MEKKIVLVCGEPSGDLQAGLLVSKLKELDKGIRVFAVGGENLRRAGAEIFQDIQGLSVLGLFDVLKKIGVFKKLMNTVLDKIDQVKPDAVVLVDFSGFNLRLARKINKRTKVIYYISPQVWASRQGRVKTIRKFIDQLIVIFKFERDFYRKFGIEAEFVGHPLLDIVQPSMSQEQARKEFGLKEVAPVFALLPGSRPGEVKRILPVMLKSARLIQAKIPNAQFIISKPSSLDNAIYEKILSSVIPRLDPPVKPEDGIQRSGIKLIEGRQYDCLNAADFVLVCSGTATLETAIMQKPNLIIYKMGLLNYLLYRPLVKLPFIGMENIVAGKMLAPEFIQFRARPQLIAEKVLEMFNDTKLLEGLKEDFTDLRLKLGPPGAPMRAAQSLMKALPASSRPDESPHQYL